MEILRHPQNENGGYNQDPVNKDDFSFEDFFRFYYPRLINYARYFLKSEQSAEDLVQDAFLQLWRNKEILKRERNIPSYMFALLRNKCLDSLKRKVVEDKYFHRQASMKEEELYFISFDGTGEYTSMEELLQKELQSLILEMPERCGTAFRLKWIEGKKIREIAKIMNISPTMVEKHLAKGLAVARKK
ncbi:MAG: RNA polymerase sigma-70 factor, partial [Mangrovibacterium sp.]